MTPQEISVTKKAIDKLEEWNEDGQNVPTVSYVIGLLTALVEAGVVTE